MKRLVSLLFVVSFGALGQKAGPIAIHNARVIPVAGTTIDRGTVVLRNGLIEAVGANVNPPADAWVIEADGLTVYPGLIDSVSNWGIADAPAATNGGRGPAPPAPPPARGPEDRPMTASWLRAADLVQPADSRLDAARSSGFTTAVTFPRRGIFAGQGAVVDLAGESSGQMIVADNAGQYVTLSTAGSGFPNSLMGVIAYVRQVYLDADHYRAAKQFYASHSRGTQRPDYDRALEGVLDSPRVLLPARRRIDVDRMLRLAAELRLNALLYGLPEGYRSADLLKQANAAVLVNLRWPEPSRDADPEEPDPLQVLQVRDRAPSTPGILAQSGVKFALYSGGFEKRADFLRSVKRATDAGLSPEDALRAMTIWPAEMFGVADRLGSIEKGKIANLVVTRGDLFQDGSQVKYVFIDGAKFEPAAEAPARPEAGSTTTGLQGANR